MCVMMDELREHAAACKSLGQFTTAEILEHAAEWISALNDTHSQERKRIRELEALASVAQGGCAGKPEQREHPPESAVLEHLEPMADVASICKRLKQERVSANLSQGALARMIGGSPDNVAKVENCKGSPSVPVLIKLGAALGLRLTWEKCE